MIQRCPSEGHFPKSYKNLRGRCYDSRMSRSQQNDLGNYLPDNKPTDYYQRSCDPRFQIKLPSFVGPWHGCIIIGDQVDRSYQIRKCLEKVCLEVGRRDTRTRQFEFQRPTVRVPINYRTIRLREVYCSCLDCGIGKSNPGKDIPRWGGSKRNKPRKGFFHVSGTHSFSLANDRGKRRVWV